MPSCPQTSEIALPAFWRGFLAALTGQSVGWAIGLAVIVAAMIAPVFVPPWPILLGRTMFVAIVLLLAFTATGQWRGAALPRWVAGDRGHIGGASRHTGGLPAVHGT